MRVQHAVPASWFSCSYRMWFGKAGLHNQRVSQCSENVMSVPSLSAQESHASLIYIYLTR